MRQVRRERSFNPHLNGNDGGIRSAPRDRRGRASEVLLQGGVHEGDDPGSPRATDTRKATGVTRPVPLWAQRHTCHRSRPRARGSISARISGLGASYCMNCSLASVRGYRKFKIASEWCRPPAIVTEIVAEMIALGLRNVREQALC